MERQIANNLSTVVLVIVALLVLGGTIRLVLSHWSYMFLVLSLLGAAYYIFFNLREK